MAGVTTTGRRLGRYHLGDPLGGGPCGEVYRAKVYGVAGFERQFAVKRFHPELVATPVVPQRLSTAARAYGSLEHPRIARLHEYGVAGGEVFTATEMVAGLDVMRLIAATHGSGVPLPAGAALALATQAARAVGYAHGRGLAHLGICPTNVIVTPDGDVKITDFGMLAQTLTIRPSDDGRLVHRIHHLAPEQLIGEAASAASDVFALGSLIHELVTGERAFVGVAPRDVEHAILSGHVRDAGLPKAMSRVLARCFARSPFERFPDARALADAIDAALRVTPVAGGRRELGGIVKDAVARLDAMNEGQLSGAMMLAMPMPPQPVRAPASKPRLPVPAPPMTPPPELVRPRPAPPATPPPRPTSIGMAVPNVPAIAARRPGSSTRPPPITPPALPGRTKMVAVPPPPVPDEDTQERTLQREPAASMSPAGPLPAPPSRVPNASPLPFPTPPPEIETASPPPPPPPEHGRPLRLDSAWPEETSAIPDGSAPLDGMRPSEPLIEYRVSDDSEGVPVVPPVVVARVETIPPPFHEPLPLPAPPTTVPPTAPAKKKSSAIGMVLFLLVCAGFGVGAMLAYNEFIAEPDTNKAPSKPPVATNQVVDDDDKAEPPPPEVKPKDAPVIVPDAGVAPVAEVVPDAGAAQVDDPVPDPVRDPDPVPDNALPKLSGDLRLETEPKALVYVDGEKEGKTPLKAKASDAVHHVALFAKGRELWVGEIPWNGKREIELPKVKQSDGDAGIKVKCRKKNRYYVYVDGKHTGQLCPTEEIEVAPGDHLVEIYDLETREKKPFPVTAPKSRNSFKLIID